MRFARGTLVFLVCLTALALGDEVGDSCRTPNKESATCISIYDCPVLLSTIRSIRERSEEQVRFLRESQCGHSSAPLVCCGSKDTFTSRGNNVEGRTSNRGGITTRSGLIPDRSSCGSQFVDKILNGEDTSIDEFPWMVLLEYQNSVNSRKRYSCGGSIINSRYILTAAHCVTGEITRKVGSLTTVRLGEWNIDTSVDCVELSGGFSVCNEPPQDFGVEETIVHPEYDSSLQHRYYDIALIRLNREIKFSNYIRPICLPLPNETSSVGEQLVVAGWGKTEIASRSSVKKKLQVPLAAPSSCGSTFRSANIVLRDTQLCAGGEADKDSCTGDSGGPLMRQINADASQWYIEGIVSFGAKCGTKGWPGVYTKVSSYLDWIHKTVKP